jgi:hypothetical protein
MGMSARLEPRGTVDDRPTNNTAAVLLCCSVLLKVAAAAAAVVLLPPLCCRDRGVLFELTTPAGSLRRR